MTSAAAQQVTFRGVALGAPPEQTRARLQALGFRFRGADQDGEHVYGADDGSELVVTFDARGAVRFEQRWEGAPPFVRRRARVLGDSLTRALGRRWERAGVTLFSNDEPGPRIRSPFVTLTVADSARFAAVEAASISAASRLNPDTRVDRAADTAASGESAIVGGQGRSPIELDVSGARRVRPGVYRTRLFAEYWWLMRLPNGMKYDREWWEGELDCARLTWETARVERSYGNRRLPPAPESTRWTSPLMQPGGQGVARTSCSILQAPRVADAQLTLWDLPASAGPAAVRAAAQAHGYGFRGVDQAGAHVYGGAAGAELLASFDSAGVTEMELRWPGTPAAARRRYDALADSLRRVLGPPRPAEDATARSWVGRDAALYAQYDDRRRGRGEAVTTLTVHTFRRDREMERRAQAAEEESRRRYAENRPVPRDTAVDGEWRFLVGDRDDMLLLDTASIAPTGAGVYRARIREEWRDFRRLPNGLMYTGELRVMEIDCARRRWRVLRVHHSLDEHRVEAAAVVPSPAWSAPAAGTQDARALRAACAAMPVVGRPADDRRIIAPGTQHPAPSTPEFPA